MSDFNATYPGYAATARLDKLRATEYSYLDKGGHVYLDYTGAGLAAQSQLLAHTARLQAGCYGNPHSDNPTSSASTHLVEQAREAVLRFFNTTAADYAVIFTPNATGACRLVAEAYPGGRRTRFVLTADNHNSVHGIREYAQARGAQVAYAGLSGTELRTRAADGARAAAQRGGRGRRARHGSRRQGRAVRVPGAVQLQRRAAPAGLGAAGAGRRVRRAARRGSVRWDESTRPVRDPARVRGRELVQGVRVP